MAQAQISSILDLRGREGSRYYIFPKLESIGGIFHATSTRDFVDERSFYNVIGIPWDKVVSGAQVHRDEILLVTPAEIGTQKSPGVDALITKEHHVPLSIRTADCLAIILIDPSSHALGVVHAGWRGSIANIVRKTISRMENELKANPEQMFAALSPSIGGCCYLVSDVVLKPLQSNFSNWQEYTFEEEGQAHLDLKALNRDQLIQGGVPYQNIAMSLFCTSCMNDQFFSHRKEGIGVGRLFTVAMLI